MSNNVYWVVRMVALEDETQEDGILGMEAVFNTRQNARKWMRDLRGDPLVEHQFSMFKRVKSVDGHFTDVKAR